VSELDDWFHFFVDRHLDRMLAIAIDLGDELVNAVPDLPGANSAYQIVVHCCGMLQWWVDAAVLGHTVDRDRDAEFMATGRCAELEQHVDALRERLRGQLIEIDPDGPLLGDPSPRYAGTPLGSSARGVLMHVLEELAQHHGHLEITRDLVTRRDG
jgi:hypothetical protein